MHVVQSLPSADRKVCLAIYDSASDAKQSYIGEHNPPSSVCPTHTANLMLLYVKIHLHTHVRI